jgi:DegV family protein with EDD domain
MIVSFINKYYSKEVLYPKNRRERNMTTAIVTDTACNVTPELAEEWGIHVLPLEIIFGETSYKEGFELSTEEFYEKMEAADELPKTSQPNIADAYELYQELSQEYDEILSIHMSAELSGTFQALRTVAEEIEDAEITFYDTKLVTVPARELVFNAKRLADEGKSAAEITQELDQITKNISTYFAATSLENLVEGGRISSIAGAIVKFIKIKPVISLDSEGINMLNTVRSSKRALKKLEQHLVKHIESVDYPFKLIIGHADYLEEAENLRDKLLNKYPNHEIEIQPITAVIGVHTGAGALGVVVAQDHREM